METKVKFFFIGKKEGTGFITVEEKETRGSMLYGRINIGICMGMIALTKA